MRAAYAMLVVCMWGLLWPDAAWAGRWKSDGKGGCYWDQYDSGPNQCQPGRWKTASTGCQWVAYDLGPNQCVPPPTGTPAAPLTVTATKDGYWLSMTFVDTDGNGGTLEGSSLMISPTGFRAWGNFQIVQDGTVRSWNVGTDLPSVASGYTHLCHTRFHNGIDCCDTPALNRAFGGRYFARLRDAYMATIGAGFGAGLASRPLLPAIGGALSGWFIGFLSWEAGTWYYDCRL